MSFPPPQQQVVVDPPLDDVEIAFLSGFVRHAALRRVWAAQPGPHSPWCPTPEGHLVLDQRLAVAQPEQVGPWLRFLIQELLAPRSSATLELALAHGLRCGHTLTGEVAVVPGHTVSICGNHVREGVRSVLPPTQSPEPHSGS